MRKIIQIAFFLTVNIYIEKNSSNSERQIFQENEKPLTKAVWRTKYKGFPLAVVRVCVCVSVCVVLSGIL